MLRQLTSLHLLSRLALICGAIGLLHATAPTCFAAASQRSLRTQIQTVIEGPDYKHAHWGLFFVNLQNDKVIYQLNADKLFAPASTTKLYTVATALDELGADYRFQTPIVRRGEVNSAGELNGDLILVANGDLSLGGRTDANGHIAFKNSDHTYANGNETGELTEPDPLAGLNELARQVAASGLKRVRGEVMIDDRLFEKAEGTGSGPSRITPILVNDNLIDLLITPGKVGEPASVKSRPETAAFQVEAQVETVEAGKETSVQVSSASSGRIVVKGKIPTGHKPLVRVFEVPEAAAFARTLLIEALRRTGVAVDASPLRANPASSLPDHAICEKLPRVAMLTSPRLAESARLILKVSHNLHASTLPLLVAARHGQRTLADGLHRQHDFLKRVGIDVEAISFGGGAGGARADYTTPRVTVQLLRYMAQRQDFAAYEAALPVLGVDGTLASTVSTNSPARGKVHAKTGTLFWDNVMNGGYVLTSKALAGYMTTRKGRRLAFAIFVNNTHLSKEGDTSREGKVLGRLCEIVYLAE